MENVKNIKKNIARFEIDDHRSYWFFELDDKRTALVDQKNNSVESFKEGQFSPFIELI